MSQPNPYSGTNVRLFPHIETRTTTTTTGSSSTSSTSSVEDCQILLRNKVELLRQLYMDAIGYEMSPSILRQLLTAISSGTPWQYYEYALQETAEAPQPAWRYTMAIVRRLVAGNVPADDVRGSQQRQRKQERRLLREQDYTQREYTHTEDAVDAMMAAWQRGEPI